MDPKYNTIPVPRYVLFVNDKSLLTDSYSQYLRNKIREAYPAPGIPVSFIPTKVAALIAIGPGVIWEMVIRSVNSVMLSQ